jgi:hypothetical protein
MFGGDVGVILSIEIHVSMCALELEDISASRQPIFIFSSSKRRSLMLPLELSPDNRCIIQSIYRYRVPFHVKTWIRVCD